jgi:hypothetical protein
MTESVCKRALASYFESNRRVFLDRYFTSIPLLRFLRSKHIYGAGTIKPTRKYFPPSLSARNLGGRAKIQGFYSHVDLEDGLTAGAYMDSALVSFVTACHHPSRLVQMERNKKGGDSVHLLAPEFLEEQNQYARGVDRFDQQMSCHPVGRRSRRWYIASFVWLLNTAITNACIMMRTRSDHFDHPIVLSQLSAQIFVKYARFSTRQLPPRPLGDVRAEVIRHSGIDHVPEEEKEEKGFPDIHHLLRHTVGKVRFHFFFPHAQPLDSL